MPSTTASPHPLYDDLVEERGDVPVRTREAAEELLDTTYRLVHWSDAAPSQEDTPALAAAS